MVNRPSVNDTFVTTRPFPCFWKIFFPKWPRCSDYQWYAYNVMYMYHAFCVKDTPFVRIKCTNFDSDNNIMTKTQPFCPFQPVVGIKEVLFLLRRLLMCKKIAEMPTGSGWIRIVGYPLISILFCVFPQKPFSQI